MKILLGTTTALCLMSALAIAQDKPDEARFEMKPNPAFLTCLAASALRHALRAGQTWRSERYGHHPCNGLKPYLNFDLFTVQRNPLDQAVRRCKVSRDLDWLGISLTFVPMMTGSQGGDQRPSCLIRFLALMLTLSQRQCGSTTPAGTVLKPTNTFHMGFWFNNPADAAPCGFDVNKPTPFNGEHRAGPLAMISVPVPPANLGPLCTSPTGSAAAADIVARTRTIRQCLPAIRKYLFVDVRC